MPFLGDQPLFLQICDPALCGTQRGVDPIYEAAYSQASVEKLADVENEEHVPSGLAENSRTEALFSKLPISEMLLGSGKQFFSINGRSLALGRVLCRNDADVVICDQCEQPSSLASIMFGEGHACRRCLCPRLLRMRHCDSATATRMSRLLFRA